MSKVPKHPKKVHRKAYMRKNGTHVKSTNYVAMRDDKRYKDELWYHAGRGLPGYNLSESDEARHRALERLAKHRNHDEIFHELLGIANVTEKSQSGHSRKYRSDAKWFSKKYLGK
jgi:hypothetical protein